MRLSLGLTTSMPLGRAIELAALAEESGYSRIWVGEDVLSREVFSYIAVVADHTRRIPLATGITTPYARNLADLACAAAGVCLVSGGRFAIGLGTGGLPELERFAGRRPERPVEVLEETVALLRRLFAGEEVTHRGARAHLERFRLLTQPDVPPRIYVAARGPRMLSLAGRVADGVLFSGPRSLLGGMMATVDAAARQAGRRPGDVERVLWNCFILAEGETDLRLARLVVATMAASLPDAVAQRIGLGEGDLSVLREAMASRDHGRAGELVSEKLMAELCIGGRIDEVEAQFAELERLGFTELVVGPPFGSDPTRIIARLAPAGGL